MSQVLARSLGLSLLAGIALAGCDAVDDPLSKEPQTSYCEAVCDWAVSCHAADRELDAAAVTAACLDATRALDPDCAVAEGEGLDAIDSVAVEKCTGAIEEERDAAECGAFTGTLDQQKIGTPPAECAGLGTDAQSTFDGAREATQESGDALCDRYARTYCAQLDTCLLGDFEVPQTALEVVGQPRALCEEQLATVFTNQCKADGLYAPADGFTEINAVREAARACVPAIDDMTCSDLFTPEAYPPECAGTFVSQDQALQFAGGLLDVACMFKDYAEVPIPGC